jgi:tRNA-2-methylthio-N6-dimethylallyladenosine synthase
MARTYTKKQFLDLVEKIRNMIPEVKLSTDVIVGFCSETDVEFEDTLDVMRRVEFDSAFMFKYSQRENTIASRKLVDDVSDEEKTERIVRLNELQKEISLKRNEAEIGRTLEVLVEGPSKRGSEFWMGRTDGNKIVVFEKGNFNAGDLIDVKIQRATANTLFGEVKSQSPFQIIKENLFVEMI